MARQKVDRDGLHRLLFKRADADGRLELVQLEFAEEIGLTNGHLGRIFTEMIAGGRMRKVRPGVYEITDPDVWGVPKTNAAGRPTGPRQLAWQ